MSIRHVAFLIVVAFAVTFALTPLVRRVSIKYGWVDKPNKRKVHDKPIPRTGGIAMFAGMLVATAIELIGEKYFHWGGLFFSPGLDPHLRTEVIGSFVGILIIFLVGLVDDLRELSPAVKFLGQLAAAGIVVACGVRIDYIGNPFGGGLINLPIAASYLISLFYIAGFTNVINLIDGLDGLAGGISAITATSLLFLAAANNRFDAATLAAVLIGACVAFLCFNFHPASIFMGDSGALMLGFTLAVISLLGVMRTTATMALLIPLIIIGVPLLDTASAIIRRIRGKRPIQEADKGHIHHQLLNKGFTQRQTVIIIWIWSAALAVGGYVVTKTPSILKIIAFAVMIVLSVIMAQWLGIWGVVYHHGPESGEENDEPIPHGNTKDE